MWMRVKCTRLPASKDCSLLVVSDGRKINLTLLYCSFSLCTEALSTKKAAFLLASANEEFKRLVYQTILPEEFHASNYFLILTFVRNKAGFSAFKLCQDIVI